jgi:hypothetical protein
LKVLFMASISLSPRLNLEASNSKERDTFSSLLRVLRTAEGVSLVGKAAEKASGIAVELGNSQAAVAQTRCAQAVTFLNLPRLPGVWVDFTKSVRDLVSSSNKTPAEQRRKWTKATHDGSEAIGVTAKATELAVLFSGQVSNLLEPAKPALAAVSLVNGATALAISAENLHAVRKIPANTGSSEHQKAVQQSTKSHLLAVTKNTLAVTSAILGIVLLATGFGAIPGIILLVLGLSTALVALSGKVYEEGMDSKPIDAYKHIQK